MKKLLTLLFAGAVVCSLSMPVFAQDNEKKDEKMEMKHHRKAEKREAKARKHHKKAEMKEEKKEGEKN